MCLLAIEYRVVEGAPILIAANREERFDRPATRPRVQPGLPPVLCGIDELARGTWLGANAHGVVVAVTNRRKSHLPAHPRSRGSLCRELLACSSGAEATSKCLSALWSGAYAGANFLCIDALGGAVLHGGDELRVLELTPGLHLIGAGDLDDDADLRLRLARELFEYRLPSSVDDFLATAGRVCACGPLGAQGISILVDQGDRGTVSSTLIALADNPDRCRYLHAPGAPNRVAYEDHSEALRLVLSEREGSVSLSSKAR